MTQSYNHSLCELSTPQGKVFYYKLPPGLEHLPISIKVLLEAALRGYDNFTIRQVDIENIANWRTTSTTQVEIPFQPARVVMQDFTGVPAVVDLGAMRDAIKKMGGNPEQIRVEPDPEKLAFLTQTTLSLWDTADTIRAVRDRNGL